jgi:hypothetical protein
MAVYKNVASQKLAVFAYDSTDGSPKTGDAANITAQISLNGGATAATNDVNPTELDATDAPGIYIFDLTQAETNADLIVVAPVSSTADIELDPSIIYTTPGTSTALNANAIQISGDATAADTLELFAESLDQSTGQIDAGTLAANTITDATIANDTFTADKFEAGSLDGKGDWNTVAPDNADIAAIKAKTDNLPSDPADASDIASSFSSLAGTLATIVGYIDTEIAAIKAKTDTLPASPANEATLTIIDGIVDAIKVVTDRVNGLIENSTGDRWTAKALETVGNEVGKIPRGASAIAAGGNATKTKISANGTTLVEAIT